MSFARINTRRNWSELFLRGILGMYCLVLEGSHFAWYGSWRGCMKELGES